MYTLKIRWVRHEKDAESGVVGVIDETTLFISAVEVRVHRFIAASEREQAMKSWDQAGAEYLNYLCRVDLEGDAGYEDAGRLIQVVKVEGDDEWYLATHAWLLGPNGDTIERIAP